MVGFPGSVRMSNDSTDWSALVGSRLCHDLVSPLGAIGNGVELLQMAGLGGEELALVEQAVQSAQARLRLYRLAFGAAAEGQDCTDHDLRQGLEALAERIRFDSDLPSILPRRRARRLALAALCAERALAWGGQVTLSETGLDAGADRLRIEDELWRPLARNLAPENPASATVQFALLAASGPVEVMTTPTLLSIRL